MLMTHIQTAGFIMSETFRRVALGAVWLLSIACSGSGGDDDGGSDDRGGIGDTGGQTETGVDDVGDAGAIDQAEDQVEGSDQGTVDTGGGDDRGAGEDARTWDRVSTGDAENCSAIGSELDSTIEGLMAENDIPGLAAGIVTAHGLVWAKGYGLANIADSRAVTPDTIFAIMSISKVVTATGVMQLVENGDLDLDEDINTYLDGFDVVHPQAPEATITMRHLLSHTSGIGRDDYGVLQLNIVTDDADVIPLGEMLESILDADGERYDREAPSYEDVGPGEEFHYSSIAISLAGFVAESVSDTGFDELTAAGIFQPLGMNDTSWRLTPYQDRLDDLAVMYHYDEVDGEFLDLEPFTFADYPAGSIRSSVEDLSRFLAASINAGALGEVEVLSPATHSTMLDIHYPEINSAQALGWNYRFEERTLVGHGGDDQGASTDMYYDVDAGIGVILLMNVTRRENTNAILDALFEASDACQ